MRPAGCVKALNAGFRMAPVLDLQKHMPQAFAKIGADPVPAVFLPS